MAQIGGRTMASMLNMLSMDYAGARERRKGRYEAGLGELRGVAEMYDPGYMAGQERTAIAGAEQTMVGRGLGGTTRPGAVSAGMRAGFEDVRREKRAGAMTNIAGYMAGFKDIYPEAGTLAHLVTGGFSGMLAEKGMGLQEEAMRAPGGVLDQTYDTPFPSLRDRPPMFGGGGGVPAAPTMPSYTTPGGSYGEMGGIAARASAGGPTVSSGGYGEMFGTGDLPTGYEETPTGVAPTGGMAETTDYNTFLANLKRKYGHPSTPGWSQKLSPEESARIRQGR